jgi:hypothetical protein
LRKQVEKEKEKLKKSGSVGTAVMQAAKDFSVISRFVLDEDRAAYSLTIELQSPLDLIVLRSTVHLDVLDAAECSVHISTNENDMNNKFVATCRCINNEKRVSITIRTTEGEYGELYVTVVNSVTPKAAKLLRFSVKPLSLQLRVYDPTPDEMNRPRSTLAFKGNTSVAVLREWLLTLFELPPRADEDEVEAKFMFRHVFTGAITTASYNGSELRIESESATTIAIVKECIGQLATARRVQLTETTSSFAVHDETVLSLLKLVILLK